MKNKTVLLVLLVYCLLLTGCGDAPVSERFAELSEKYDYYEKSIDQLKVIKDSTPEQLDDIFLILIDCGMDSEVTTVSEKIFSDTPTYTVRSDGASYTVVLNSENVVQTVTVPNWFSTKQLYPVISEETEEVPEAEEISEADQKTENPVVIPMRENAVGQSNSDISDLIEKTTVLDVHNDVTGNWRYITIAENTDFIEYALSYYNTYFEDDNEIHAIVNFTNKTTTKISVLGNMLDVTIYEYVDGEEHDANLMYSGMVYSEYFVYLDNGDIEQIQ